MSVIDLNTMFTNALIRSLEETFEQSAGIYLDRNSSIFETLSTISAQEASIASGAICATIAAHVAHMAYYIDILLKLISGEQPQTDWGNIWQTIRIVSPDEWLSSQKDLQTIYEQIKIVAHDMTWVDERQMIGALGLLSHNAYHLGEIRQMLCTIKSK